MSRHIDGEDGHTAGICDRCTERFEQRVKDPEFKQRVAASMERRAHILDRLADGPAKCPRCDGLCYGINATDGTFIPEASPGASEPCTRCGGTGIDNGRTETPEDPEQNGSTGDAR